MDTQASNAPDLQTDAALKLSAFVNEEVEKRLTALIPSDWRDAFERASKNLTSLARTNERQALEIENLREVITRLSPTGEAPEQSEAWWRETLDRVREVDTRIMRFRTLLQTRGLIAQRHQDRMRGTGDAYFVELGESQMLTRLARDFQNLFPWENGKAIPIDQAMLREYEAEVSA